MVYAVIYLIFLLLLFYISLWKHLSEAYRKRLPGKLIARRRLFKQGRRLCLVYKNTFNLMYKSMLFYCFRNKALYSRRGIKITVLRNTQPFENNSFMENPSIKILECKKIRKLKISKLNIQGHTKCCLTASFSNWLTWAIAHN